MTSSSGGCYLEEHKPGSAGAHLPAWAASFCRQRPLRLSSLVRIPGTPRVQSEPGPETQKARGMDGPPPPVLSRKVALRPAARAPPEATRTRFLGPGSVTLVRFSASSLPRSSHQGQEPPCWALGDGTSLCTPHIDTASGAASQTGPVPTVCPVLEPEA